MPSHTTPPRRGSVGRSLPPFSEEYLLEHPRLCCRDDSCPIPGIHARHSGRSKGPWRQCPVCLGLGVVMTDEGAASCPGLCQGTGLVHKLILTLDRKNARTHSSRLR